jgi:succinyl-CoA synthetase beta subunit
MQLNEWEGRVLLNRFGIPIPRGCKAASPQEAHAAAKELGVSRFVVKPMIRAGGRGLGSWVSGPRKEGGIAFAQSPEEVAEIAGQMLGARLRTNQTGPQGELVQEVLVAEAAARERELYVALLLDPQEAKPLVLAKRRGGTEVEAAGDRPWQHWIDPWHGWSPFEARRAAKFLGWEGEHLRKGTDLLLRLYHLFIAYDCLLLEINPLGTGPQGEDPVALDCKIFLDDNAWNEHPELLQFAREEKEPLGPWKCLELGLNYVRLGGNIGCMVNGAGLAMATVDLLERWGGRAANFFDVGGGADPERLTAGFRLLCQEPGLSVILINIFGGILRCDLLAQALLEVSKEDPPPVPVIVRLEGTRVEEGRQLLLGESRFFRAAKGFEEAVSLAVRISKGGA